MRIEGETTDSPTEAVIVLIAKRILAVEWVQTKVGGGNLFGGHGLFYSTRSTNEKHH